ncbi:hypothetical protein GQ53DRAFT_815051 [Thozetella sp. PMI_491]|nr:hypothetical protein GQ53DRAFT_815051 [Thozetella sp. PMI_491]
MESDEQTARLLDSHDGDDMDDDVTTEQGPKLRSGDEENLAPSRGHKRLRKNLVFLGAGALIAAIFGTLGYFVGKSRAEASPRAECGPHRLMIVGDSISQGWEGSYTWRYRLWQWIQENSVDAIFVGPYNGTVKAPADDKNPFWIPFHLSTTRSEAPVVPSDGTPVHNVTARTTLSYPANNPYTYSRLLFIPLDIG